MPGHNRQHWWPAAVAMIRLVAITTVPWYPRLTYSLLGRSYTLLRGAPVPGIAWTSPIPRCGSWKKMFYCIATAKTSTWRQRWPPTPYVVDDKDDHYAALPKTRRWGRRPPPGVCTSLARDQNENQSCSHSLFSGDQPLKDFSSRGQFLWWNSYTSYALFSVLQRCRATGQRWCCSPRVGGGRLRKGTVAWDF